MYKIMYYDVQNYEQPWSNFEFGSALSLGTKAWDQVK